MLYYLNLSFARAVVLLRSRSFVPLKFSHHHQQKVLLLMFSWKRGGPELYYGLKWVICQWQISTKKSPFCCKYIARDIWAVLRASFRTNQLCVSISFISIQKIYFARPNGAFALIQTSHLLEEAHFLDSAVHSKKSNLLQTITAFGSTDRSTRKVGHKVAKD